ncbi:MAG: histidine phosphatase family protein [Ferruginibacter sp.]
MYLNKLVTSFYFLVCCSFITYAQADYRNTTIYIVRHAEKDTGNNPVLTEGGRQRAGELMRLLKKVKLHHIYTTPFRRTEMTADSIRIKKGTDTIHYAAKPSAESLFTLLQRNNDIGKKVLFVGHSNTVPLLLKNFGVVDYPQADIPDDAFDNIFIIHFKKGKPTLENKKYGKPSGKSESMH